MVGSRTVRAGPSIDRGLEEVARKRALVSGVDPSNPFPGLGQTRVKEGVDGTFGMAPCPTGSRLDAADLALSAAGPN